MKTKLFCFALIVLIAIGFFSSCGNPLMDKALKPLFGPSYKIGDTGPGGGKVFYYDPVGFLLDGYDFLCHYMEVGLPTITYPWETPGSSFTATGSGLETDTDIWSGYSNTRLILASFFAAYYDDSSAEAAYVCFYGTHGNGTTEDWFLPSIEELEEIHKVKDNVGLTSWGTFWSSSEVDTGSQPLATAYYINAGGGRMPSSKYTYYQVLPVRAF